MTHWACYNSSALFLLQGKPASRLCSALHHPFTWAWVYAERGHLIKRFSYAERDYAFGQRMLTLRTSIGLTQAGLAERLGVSRRAVGEWEQGSSYPKAEHLQHLLELAVQQRIFPAGREAEEIRAFWQAAHQKVLLDESWLAALLPALLPETSPPPVLVEESSAPPAAASGGARASTRGQRPPSSESVASRASAPSGPQVDWGDALEVPSFYGREGELARLSQWIVQERCRVVSVLGLGGIGKSALVTCAMRQLASHFQVVLFRSLRDSPSCDALLEDCLKVLAPQPLEVGTADLSTSSGQALQRRLSLLLEQLREQRVLLVLDNLESVLEAGEARGQLRPGYEDYARLLQGVAERTHPSCLLLTSREKPAVLRALEGRDRPVRSLRLSGLEASACEQLLATHELLGSQEERGSLTERYEGNPLALHIVAQTIADLFGGELAPFLAQDTLVFGSLSDLLDEQWVRLSPLEQTLLFWLAILREPVTFEELRSLLVAKLPAVQVLEAVDALGRRSLVERGQRLGSLTLQSVVLEYVTGHLVEQLADEILQERLSLLIQHGLSQAQARDYVRQTQERLLVIPLLARLQSVGQSPAQLEGQLRALLEGLRGRAEAAQGYGPANLVALLRVLRGHLRGLDLSRLVLRGVFLQGVEMQDTNLSETLVQESVFTETFADIWAVAISRSGHFWAAGSKLKEVRVWREAGQRLHLAWHPHTDWVLALAFSPDERTLASGIFDGSVKLWEVESGALFWTGWHTNHTISIAFSPDSSLLASGGLDATIRLWEADSGRQLETLSHPAAMLAVSWSSDGHLLASGCVDGHIRLWERQPNGPMTCVAILAGHTDGVRALAFAPGGSILASGSNDGTVKLWEVGEEREERQERQEGNRRCLRTLEGHTGWVQCIAWSPDGGTLATGSFDHTIRLWDVQSRSVRAVLSGHTGWVMGLSFTPDSRCLLSGSDDGTLRLWDVDRAQCLRMVQGYAISLTDVAWSPDGTQLASAGSDFLVTLWPVAGATPPRMLRGHRAEVYGVGWSSDGRRLASSSFDGTVRLWDPASGLCLSLIGDPDAAGPLFYGLVWHPDG